MIKILKQMNCVTIADRIRIKSKMQIKYVKICVVIIMSIVCIYHLELNADVSYELRKILKYMSVEIAN